MADDLNDAKRPHPDNVSDDDSDEGPLPETKADAVKRVKKRRVLKHESLYLDQLPSADRYWRSYMHRDSLVSVAVAKTDFILTASVDGFLKFWKKRDVKKGEPGIEFVKQYKAHLGPIISLAVSADGLMAATISADTTEGGSVKVFDVPNFDMINMFEIPYIPKTAAWIHQRGHGESKLAISEENSNTIHIYDGQGDGKAKHDLPSIHRSPVHIIAYNAQQDTVVSADISGMIEYWSPHDPFELPTVPGLWEYKSSTDLYEFKKAKAVPLSLSFSPNGTHFVTTSLTTDRIVRVFTFLSGKLHRKYDESLAATQEMQQGGTAVYHMDEMEFGRRLATEREIEKSPIAYRECAAWDETGNFILYPTLLGVKVVNIVTNKVSRVLGKDETNRFINISLYQGMPQSKGYTTVAMAASDNPLLQQEVPRDPILFATAFKRSRFYLFTREGLEAEGKGERDIFNEKPTREEQALAATSTTTNGTSSRKLASSAVIHTEKGDVHLRLFPEHAPKAVENFVGHSKSGYYENVIFHRVIKKFMIQTGDPLGDGTGGDSIWGRNFEDEFTPELKHDRPYTLSMANAGPGTNGSQFFITTVPTPWLDNKHTIFGRVTTGMDVVHDIENLRTDKNEKPYEDCHIISIDIE